MSSTPVRSETDILRALYSVVATLRWFLLAHALVLNLRRGESSPHPWALALATIAMLVWTPLVSRWQTREEGRTWPVMAGDLALSALLLTASTPVLGRPEAHLSTIPVTGFWVLAAPMAFAIWRGPRWGLAGALAMAALRVLSGPSSDLRMLGSLGVLVLVSWGLGVMVDTIRVSSAEREANFARAAALAERDRMNRIVHDGALQVLAMVEREGAELGPKGLYLANVARQQEARLRALLQDRTVDLPDHGVADRGDIDLASLLERHDSDTVTVSVMAGEVLMEGHRAQELDAAVSEVLANVARHAGPTARAWVLLEEEDGLVIVSVRDNGHGMTRAQVAAAAASGRLGIQNSILGRVADIGGVALARSQAGRGVEWEFRVPVREAK